MWPRASEDEPAVAAMNRMPKYVVSRTITAPDWRNTSVISSDVPAQVARVKTATEGDIVVFGSGDLIQTLAAHDLVDQYRLLLFPLVLGHGKRMFRAGGTQQHLVLQASERTSSGVVICSYAPRRT